MAPGLKETVVAEKTYRSAEHAHLVAVLERFLVDSGASRGRHPTVACIAVAGPVTSNRFAQITNLVRRRLPALLYCLPHTRR